VLLTLIKIFQQAEQKCGPKRKNILGPPLKLAFMKKYQLQWWHSGKMSNFVPCLAVFSGEKEGKQNFSKNFLEPKNFFS
jgi:hypothetical protein